MFCFLDFEVSGLQPGRADPLTIGSVFADEKLNKVSDFHLGIRPTSIHAWSKEAEDVHKIPWSKAIKFKTQEEALEEFIQKCKSISDSFTFVCHAMPFGNYVNTFDRNVLFYWFQYNDRRVDYYKLFPEEKMTSTIKLKRKDAMEEYEIPNQKLATWMNKLGINSDLHHSALFDATVCYEIFKYQRRNERTMETN